jgi:hypothetical protein
MRRLGLRSGRLAAPLSHASTTKTLDEVDVASPPVPRQHNERVSFACADAGDPVATDVDLIDISVVVPAFNEEQRIGASIETVCNFLRRSGRTWELVIVDDGSSDLTASITDAKAAHEPRVKLIRSPRNRGKGHALRLGVLASCGDEVLISDADFSAPIDDLENLWAGRNGAVAAIGSRGHTDSTIEVHQGRLREALGRLGNLIIRAVAVPGISDTQCGFKLFEGPAARALFSMAKLSGWAIDVEILHLCGRFGWPVVEAPVRWSHATGSKLRPTAYFQVLAEIAYMRVAHRRAREPRLPRTNDPAIVAGPHAVESTPQRLRSQAGQRLSGSGPQRAAQ